MAPVHCLCPSGLLNVSRPHYRPDLDLYKGEPHNKRRSVNLTFELVKA